MRFRAIACVLPVVGVLISGCMSAKQAQEASIQAAKEKCEKEGKQFVFESFGEKEGLYVLSGHCGDKSEPPHFFPPQTKA